MDIFRNTTELSRLTYADLKAINETMSTDVLRFSQVFQEQRKLFKQLKHWR